MITPEDRGRFARMKEGYREWLQRARQESDERRVAARAPAGGGRRAGDKPESTEPLGDRGR
jgi:hypothetical protein